MRVKIIGFKVGEPYPTFNKTLENFDDYALGSALWKALDKSDFISIRWVK